MSPPLHRNASILVAGAETFVGAALVGRLRARGYPRVLGGDVPERDLRDAASVEELFAATNPDAVVLAAGRSGGIARNQREPADLLLDNLLVQTAVIEAAHRHRVSKLLLLASACIYPRECPQPMRPEQIGMGPIEPTSQGRPRAARPIMTAAAPDSARQRRASSSEPISPLAMTGTATSRLVAAIASQSADPL